MNGQTIRDLYELDFILSSQFHGVYSFDNIPMHVCRYPSAYIVNTASKRSIGEHTVYNSVKEVSSQNEVYKRGHGLLFGQRGL